MRRFALAAVSCLRRIATGPVTKLTAACLFALMLAPAQRASAQFTVVNGISTIAGTGATCSAVTAACGDGAAATSATLYRPYHVALDRSGNLFVADTYDNRIRRIDAVTGAITTVAGTGTACASATSACGDGGAATSANLHYPYGVAVDASGNLYIADYSDNRVRKVDATTGIITAFAGTGTACSSATAACGDGAAAASGTLHNPYGVAVDLSGNVYIADLSDNRIRKVDATTGFLNTVAGTGAACSPTTAACGDNAAAASANLTSPTGVAVDRAGNVYIADYGDNRIRKLTLSTGNITTIAGTGAASFSGDTGAATSATLSSPSGLSVDLAGNVYVADYANDRIREIFAATGIINTVAGTGTSCSGTPTAACGDGGAATSATISNPYTVTSDARGNLYIPDRLAMRIRLVTPSNLFPSTADGSSLTQNVLVKSTAAENITQIAAAATKGSRQEFTAGTVTGCTVDPTGATATASGSTCIIPVTFTPAYPGQRLVPLGIATTASGTTTTYNIGLAGTATGSQVVFTPGVISTIAGSSTPCASAAAACADGSAATGASLIAPYGTAVDSTGNLYIADASEHRVRRVDAATGKISTIAGTGVSGSSGDGVAATSATLTQPYGIAVDAAHNVYIADSGANNIRRVDASTGLISTVAGSGTACSTSTAACGDGAAATSANLNAPAAVAVDPWGNLYIADLGDHRVREVSASTGFIATVAGNGTAASSGDGAAATSASLESPASLAVDPAGALYIADQASNVIRKVDAFTGHISTVAGTGSASSSGDGSAASSATINAPSSIVLDPAGDLYIAEAAGSRVRRIDASTGLISTIAGNGTPGSTGDGASATSAQLTTIKGLALDSTGRLYLADNASYDVRLDDTTAGVLNFATPTIVGSLDSTDGPQAAALSNIGNTALTLAVPSAGTNPSISSSFSFDPATTCPQLTSSSPAATLAAGSSCTVSVDFTPALAGPISGAVVATDNALNVAGSTQSIALHATGKAAVSIGVTTTTAVSLPSSSIVYGSSINLSATVTPATGTASPIGSVSFIDTVGTTILTVGSQTVTNGVATLAYTPASAGAHTITAIYSTSDSTKFQSSADTVGQSFSVTQLAPVITVAPASITYGASPTMLSAAVAYSGPSAPTGAVTFTVDGGTAVSAACTGSSSPLTCTASYVTSALTVSSAHVIKVSIAADANYSAASQTGALAVTQATPKVTVTAVTINTGTSPTTLTANVAYSGGLSPTGAVTFSVNGTTLTGTCTGSATPIVCTASYITSNVSSGNYTVTATLATDTNYAAASGGNTLTVTAQNFTLASSSQYVSVAGGQSVSLNFALSPIGSIYPGAVTFAVSGLPAGATYTLTPTTVAQNGGATTVTLTFQTTTAMAAREPHRLLWEKGTPLILSALALPFFLRRRSRMRSLWLTLMLLGIAAGVTGCGTADTTPTGKDYAVLLVATSGTVQKTSGVTLYIHQ